MGKDKDIGIITFGNTVMGKDSPDNMFKEKLVISIILLALLVINTKEAIPKPKPYRAISIGKRVIIAGSIPPVILNPNIIQIKMATVKEFIVVIINEKIDLPIS